MYIGGQGNRKGGRVICEEKRPMLLDWEDIRRYPVERETGLT